MILALWAVYSWKIFISCRWLNSGDALELQGFWTETQIWTLLTLCVLAYVILVVFFPGKEQSANEGAEQQVKATHSHHSGRQTLLSLLGGFAIALPALAVTVLAFATAFPHFLQALKGSMVDPSKPEIILKSSDSDLGSAYVLGIDVSQSVIRDQKEDKLVQIHELVNLLFSRDPERVLDSLIDSGDVYWSYAFAGEQYPLAQRGQAFQDIRVAAFPTAFKEAIDQHLERPGERRDKTDILSFLESMVANLKVSEAKNFHTTVLVFSDFRQDAGALSFTDVRERVRKIMGDLQDIDNVHLVGVYMGAEGGQKSGIDIRRYLDDYSSDGLWREISLVEFAEADIEKRKSMLVFNIYREVRQEVPLYLKYQVAPWKPIQANIDISGDPAYDGILVGIRHPRGSDGSTPNITVALGDDDRTVLATRDSDSNFEIIRRMYSTENPMPINLQSRLDISRAVECDLLIAVPSRALVHSVPVIILPVLGDRPLQMLRWSLFFIGIVAVFLAVSAIALDQFAHGVVGRLGNVRRSRRPIQEGPA